MSSQSGDSNPATNPSPAQGLSVSRTAPARHVHPASAPIVVPANQDAAPSIGASVTSPALPGPLKAAAVQAPVATGVPIATLSGKKGSIGISGGALDIISTDATPFPIGAAESRPADAPPVSSVPNPVLEPEQPGIDLPSALASVETHSEKGGSDFAPPPADAMSDWEEFPPPVVKAAWGAPEPDADKMAGPEVVAAAVRLCGQSMIGTGPRVQPRGLTNPGNLCFMNATLQVC